MRSMGNEYHLAGCGDFDDSESLLPDPPSRLVSLLPPEFAVPFGTPLTLEDFHLIDPDLGKDADGTESCTQWVISALDERGLPITYSLCLTSVSEWGEPFATCVACSGLIPIEGCGEVSWDVPVFNYFTRRLGSKFAAPLHEWVQTVMVRDSEGRAEYRWHDWNGDDLDSVMKRTELGICESTETEASTDSFTTADELQDWLAEALKTSQTCCLVYDLTDLPCFDVGLWHREITLKFLEGREVRAHWVAAREGLTKKEWLGLLQQSWLPGQKKAQAKYQPTVQLHLSGTDIMSMSSLFTFSWESLTEAKSVVHRSDGPSDWFIIHFERTDLCVLVPRDGTNIGVEVHGDGARVSVDVRQSSEREQHHRLNYGYGQRWGHWLDDTQTLGEQELAAGIIHAETEALKLMQKENLS